MLKVSTFLIHSFLSFWLTLLAVGPAMAQSPRMARGPGTRLGHHPVSESLCLDPIQYVQCFQFSQQECLSEADLAVASCIRRLPAPPADGSDQGQWATALGYCTEESFALWNRRRLLPSPWCQDLLKKAESRHNQSQYQWERGALKPRTRDQYVLDLVQIVLPPLAMGLLLPLGVFYASFAVFARRGARDGRLVWTRNLLYPLFLAGAVLGEIAGHVWNADVYLSISPDPWQVGGIVIALAVSPVYFLLAWLLHRGLRAELRSELESDPR